MPNWWPLVLLWVASLVVVGASCAIAAVATVHIRSLRRAEAAAVAGSVEEQPTQMAVGRAAVSHTYVDLPTFGVAGNSLPPRDFGVREIGPASAVVVGAEAAEYLPDADAVRADTEWWLHSLREPAEPPKLPSPTQHPDSPAGEPQSDGRDGRGSGGGDGPEPPTGGVASFSAQPWTRGRYDWSAGAGRWSDSRNGVVPNRWMGAAGRVIGHLLGQPAVEVRRLPPPITPNGAPRHGQGNRRVWAPAFLPFDWSPSGCSGRHRHGDAAGALAQRQTRLLALPGGAT